MDPCLKMQTPSYMFFYFHDVITEIQTLSWDVSLNDTTHALIDSYDLIIAVCMISIKTKECM